MAKKKQPTNLKIQKENLGTEKDIKVSEATKNKAAQNNSASKSSTTSKKVSNSSNKTATATTAAGSAAASTKNKRSRVIKKNDPKTEEISEKKSVKTTDNSKAIEKGKFKITPKEITLSSGKKIKVLFSYWVILFVIIILLILTIITLPNRTIRSNLMNMESIEEIQTYCTDNNFNCTISTLSDYDITGYKVSRVAFLADDFFNETLATTSEETTTTTSSSTSEDDSSSDNSSKKTKRNIYITVQKGVSVESEDTSETESSESTE